MPKTTQELANSRAGETAESNGFGAQERPLRPAGLYELKNDDGEVVDRLIVKVHPKFGDGQASAVERVGYKYVRPARKDEVKEIEVDATQLATEDRNGNTSDDVKGLKARANEQDRIIKELQDKLAGANAENTSGASDNDVKANAKEEAKTEAEARVQARQEGTPGGAEETQRTEEIKAGDPLSNDDSEGSDDEETEKPLSQQNKDELRATAEAEGVELDEEKEHDTNAKIRDAITKAREEKEKGNQ